MSSTAWERFVHRGRWSLLASLGVAASLLLACGDDAEGPAAEANTGGLDSGPDAESSDGGMDAEQPDVAETGGEEGWTSMCSYEDGAAIPYDHARGIIEEYSFELAMNCELGGFMAPLVEADPIELTEVLAYNDALTDWYRGRILGCDDASSPEDENAFLLVPPSQAAGMSKGDFDAVVALFGSILDRHEGMPDAMTTAAKAEVKTRLETFEDAAVEQDTLELTKPSSAPECAQDG